jgi:hypothetical protein
MVLSSVLLASSSIKNFWKTLEVARGLILSRVFFALTIEIGQFIVVCASSLKYSSFQVSLRMCNQYRALKLT